VYKTKKLCHAIGIGEKKDNREGFKKNQITQTSAYLLQRKGIRDEFCLALK
jgi:hypothetical protein